MGKHSNNSSAVTDYDWSVEDYSVNRTCYAVLSIEQKGCPQVACKTTERYYLRYFYYFIVDFEHISHIVFGVSIVDFEKANTSRISKIF